LNPKLKELVKAMRDFVRDNVFWVWRYALLEGKVDEMVKITPDIPVEYRFGDFSDIDRMDIEHHEYDAEARKFALECFESGGKMIIGCYEGCIIFYLWLMFSVMDTNYRNYLPISSNRVYAYKGFTVKDCRGRQVLAGAYRLLADYMKQTGYSKVIASIDVRNHPSIKSAIKVGYRPIGSILKIRILSYQKCVLSNGLSSRLRDECL
jgi:RimJ/RimL family protein N-acetyltransferase